MWEISVKKADRLDRLLRAAAISPWMSRQAWEAAIEEGWIRIGNRILRKPGEVIGAGSNVEAHLPPLGLNPDPTPAELVWREGDLAVFNKSPGVPTYPLLPWETGTLANGIARELDARGILNPAAFAALADPPVLEGGLLQRLDRDTSGLVTVAFTKEAKAAYRQVFSGKVDKGYLAITAGAQAFASGNYEVNFLPGGAAKVAASLVAKPGAVAVSFDVKVLASGRDAQLLEARTSHGLRHVVRAGLSALGAPLVGDELYGGAKLAPFHQLHAHSLKIPGLAEITSSPPKSFLDCLESLGLHYSR
jgi:23S rRNA pseudouridine1911/1915/1917 synthase